MTVVPTGWSAVPLEVTPPAAWAAVIAAVNQLRSRSHVHMDILKYFEFLRVEVTQQAAPLDIQ